MEKTVKEKIVDYAIEMISRLVITIAYAFVYGIIIYFLWNWLMPKFFGLQHATFWQALGLSFLSSAFFKDLFIKKEQMNQILGAKNISITFEDEEVQKLNLILNKFDVKKSIVEKIQKETSNVYCGGYTARIIANLVSERKV
jgi:hypothetical protein